MCRYRQFPGEPDAVRCGLLSFGIFLPDISTSLEEWGSIFIQRLSGNENSHEKR